MPTRKEAFAVHTYEVDAFGTLSVPALSGFMQEIAGLHAAELGAGMEALQVRGLTWVLARQRIENPEPIRQSDSLEIETWPSGVDRLAALREFVVRRSDGVEVARATTEWLALNADTRRPARPTDVLDSRFPRERGPSLAPLTPGKLPELRDWEAQKRFHVRYSDIDVNLHATNTSYLEWAIEAVPREVWQSRRLATLEAQYLAEVRYGSAILSRVAATGDGMFAHSIVDEEEEKDLARLVTGWVAR